MDRVCDIRNILMSGVNAEATVWNVGYLNHHLISQMRLISCGSLRHRHIGVLSKGRDRMMEDLRKQIPNRQITQSLLTQHLVLLICSNAPTTRLPRLCRRHSIGDE